MKRFLSLSVVLIVLLSCFSFAAYAAKSDVTLDYSHFVPYEKATIPGERLKPRLVDVAGVIPDDKEASLTALLDSKSEETKLDIAVVTVSSTNGKEPEAYADDYYDYNGFGYGKSRDGLVLLISFDPRYVHVSTCGKAEKIIRTDDIDSFLDIFYYEIKTENFTKAVELYVGGVEKEVSDYNSTPLKLVAVALIAGFIIASIIVKSMKSKLVTVRSKTEAAEYVIPGSLALTAQNDAFLYRNVTRTAIPKESSSSGGSHTSSSGSSHGGGGRSF